MRASMSTPFSFFVYSFALPVSFAGKVLSFISPLVLVSPYHREIARAHQRPPEFAGAMARAGSSRQVKQAKLACFAAAQLERLPSVGRRAQKLVRRGAYEMTGMEEVA